MAYDQISRHLSEAEGYVMLNMPLKALEILERRSDWANMQFEASLIAGEALRMLERYREAAKSFENAAKLRPNDLQMAIPLAWCYKRTNRLAQAIATLETASNAHPEEALLHYNLACYWSLAGTRQKAFKSLARALELDVEFVRLISDEPDFDPVRDDPVFQRIVEAVKPMISD